MKPLIPILILSLILSACAETGVSLTLESNYSLAGTQVQDLRLTATVQSARAETTLDFMGTRAAVSGTQSSFLVETLVATGFSPEMLATQREQFLGNSPTPVPLATLALGGTLETGTQATLQADTFTPSPPAVTINAPQPTSTSVIQATPDLGGMRVGNLLTATGEGTDGCGAGITAAFGMDVTEIYVILPVFNLTANDYTFSARWQRNGQSVGPVYDYTPGTDSESLCIWFFVDETDFAFEPGNYTVSIDVNGQAVAGPVPFVIQ